MKPSANRKSRISHVSLILSALFVAGGIALACEQTRSSGNEGNAVGTTNVDDAVDTELVAYLSRARALHHEANLKEEMGDRQGAADAMTRLVSQPFSRANTPEVEDVLADAFARRAEILLAMGKLDDAKATLQSGLAHAKDATYFRGHLVEVSGLVDESIAANLADAGKSADAKAIRERALAELEDAIHIQEQVLNAVLPDGGRDGGSR